MSGFIRTYVVYIVSERRVKSDGKNRDGYNAAAPQERKIRTAAYCRVSSDSADQLHSFSAQVRYYTRLIGDNECMELVDIYADEGISGTKTKNERIFAGS